MNLSERIRVESAPLIDGERVTFVWEGAEPPALITDAHNWEEQPVMMESVAEGLWIHTLQLPRQTYLEYAYLDLETGERPIDPFNRRRRVPNGMGKINHYFYMPEARPHPLTRRSPAIPQGKVTRHVLPTNNMLAGKNRVVYLYEPHTSQGPYPLLVVYDGNDYLRRGRLVQIVDNLIGRQRIKPIAMALVENNPPARMVEYGCSEITLGFIAMAVLPQAQSQIELVNLEHEPGAFGIMGASMGGLMALFSGLRLPHIFGHVLSQSGAFSIEEYDMIVYDLVRYAPIPQLRLWMDVGQFEWLLETNRRMHSLLDERQILHGYSEYMGGHNYTSWRNDLWRGLEYLFGNDQEHGGP
jgi:enterochelin esterase-like enzyme